jgi:YggT family protein
MAPLVNIIFFVLDGLFSLVIWALIISAIISWLTAFNIINLNNRNIYQIVSALNRFTDVILAPFRAVIPPLGGLDLSFIVAYLVIKGIQIYLLPAAHSSMMQLVSL